MRTRTTPAAATLVAVGALLGWLAASGWLAPESQAKDELTLSSLTDRLRPAGLVLGCLGRYRVVIGLVVGKHRRGDGPVDVIRLDKAGGEDGERDVAQQAGAERGGGPARAPGRLDSAWPEAVSEAPDASRASGPGGGDGGSTGNDPRPDPGAPSARPGWPRGSGPAGSESGRSGWRIPGPFVELRSTERACDESVPSVAQPSG